MVCFLRLLNRTITPNRTSKLQGETGWLQTASRRHLGVNFLVW